MCAGARGPIDRAEKPNPSDEQALSTIYREEQRFRQWWVVVLVGGLGGLAWWTFIRQVLLAQPIGDRPAPDWGVWLLWALVGLVLPFFFYYVRMALHVTPDRVVIHYRPLSKRVIALAEIQEVEVRQYRAIKEYGGWGIKGWTPKNVAYNVSGNQGVELKLRDGRRVMLGSQRAQDLADAIQTARKRKPMP